MKTVLPNFKTVHGFFGRQGKAPTLEKTKYIHVIVTLERG